MRRYSGLVRADWLQRTMLQRFGDDDGPWKVCWLKLRDVELSPVSGVIGCSIECGADTRRRSLQGRQHVKGIAKKCPPVLDIVLVASMGSKVTSIAEYLLFEAKKLPRS